MINQIKMKEILTLIFFVISLTASSQIYYNGEKLYSSRITGKKLGNLLGAYMTVGLSSAKQSLIVEGETSENVIKDKRPEFTFKFGNAKDSLFMDRANMDKNMLVKIYPKKRLRQLRIGKYGLVAGVQTNAGGNDAIALRVEEDEEHEGVFTVRPREDLDEGEYCFFYTDKEMVKNASKVYDFSIRREK